MEEKKYIYRPVRFYVLVFVFTWLFWIPAAFMKEGVVSSILMILGLISPSSLAIITVFTSKSNELKADFKRKIFGFYKLKLLYILLAVLIFAVIVVGSILISLLFGGSIEQFYLTKDFSFSGPGFGSAILTILLASVLEEVGWRGYGEDSIAQYCSWFKESVIFGFIWASWHIPLFFLPGTYHIGLKEMGFVYMLNFLLSVIPMGFITTWVYVKNGRSMLSSILFHLFVNFMQEKIAMSPDTKIIESFVVLVAAVIIVLTNKDMFFEKRHVGQILES